MPEEMRTKDKQTQEYSRPRLAVLLRPLAVAPSLLLAKLLSSLNRDLRQALIKIPGVLAAYVLISRWCLSAGSKNGIPCAQINGLNMYLDPSEGVGLAASFLWGQYEVATTAVVMQVVTDGDVVVDVGAHWGYFTLLAASLCGERGRVFAFEPHPKNFALLSKNVEANRLTKVTAVRKAVSDHSGISWLAQDSSSTGHSLCTMPPELGVGEHTAKDAIAVETVALDDFLTQSSVEPRLIKLDVEGAEPLALAGMQRLIERNPSLVLIAEFSSSYQDAKAAADFLDLLGAWSFDVAVIDDKRRQLAVGPKAAMLKRLLDGGAAYNVLATRDRPLFERLLRQQDRFSKRIGHLETVRL